MKWRLALVVTCTVAVAGSLLWRGLSYGPPSLYSCRVDAIRPEAATVLFRYPTTSATRTSCASAPPRQLLVKGQGYDVFIEMLDEGAPIVGLRGSEPEAFEIMGGNTSKIGERSVYSKRATHYIKLVEVEGAASAERRLEFTVINKRTGVAAAYSYVVDLVECECKEYDFL